ncbi:hypothetical protein KAR91_78040, partial [Candidatus Pacearchaeota archaeon]|nr:hypothetical protein [Candidatus Pacearchaeota archaeon]
MRLDEFAKQSRYLNWNETDTYNICLQTSFEEFISLGEIASDKFDSSQFEIPIFIISGKDVEDSIFATKSKVLLNELISYWNENEDLILKVHKKGSGFYTKYTVTSTFKVYHKVSGK